MKTREVLLATNVCESHLTAAINEFRRVLQLSRSHLGAAHLFHDPSCRVIFSSSLSIFALVL